MRSPGWTLTESLLCDVYKALTGEEHPAQRAVTKKAEAAAVSGKVARLRAQKARLAASQTPPE